jgi:hypothetical protein
MILWLKISKILKTVFMTSIYTTKICLDESKPVIKVAVNNC